MNINLLLENSLRADLSGYNFSVSNYKLRSNEKCEPVEFGMPGTIFLGHELKEKDLLKYSFSEHGNELKFNTVRHRWTPAWCNTTYRSNADESYYKKDGLIAVNEKKCINYEDVFISHITVFNDSNTDKKIRFNAHMNTQKGKNGCIFESKISQGALGQLNDIRCYVYTLFNNDSRPSFDFEVKANSEFSFKIIMAFSAESMGEAEEKCIETLKKNDPFNENEINFNKWFEDNVPQLICDDLDLLKVYYYRFYLIKRNTHTPSDIISNHPLDGKCLYESPTGCWYSCPVGLSVPIQIEEAGWCTEKTAVDNTIRYWQEKKGTEAGGYRGYIQYTPMAIWNYYNINPNKDMLKKVFSDCCEFTLSNLDSGSKYGFKPTEGSWITGAEYQPSFYQLSDKKWNWCEDVEGVRMGRAEKLRKIYRVDSLCFTILNLQACAFMSLELNRQDEYAFFSSKKQYLTEILKEYFWNREKNAFCDIDYLTERQCDEAIGYNSFEPFISNIAGSEFFSSFKLLDKELKSEFSFTTVDKNCPMYWFDNEIVGPFNASLMSPHAYDCCWNGPVWPYANTFILEGLGCASKTDKKLRKKWITFFKNYIELHFRNGNRSFPVICEHYCPTDGRSFSPQFDYFHSKWIDLFMKYFAGIDVKFGEATRFDPYYEGEFELKNVKIGENKYDFVQTVQNSKVTRSFKKRP